MKATALLRRDHATVRKLFARFGRLRPTQVEERRAVADSIATELEIHAKLEEEMFYPLLEPIAPELIEEGADEHGSIRSMVADVHGADPASRELDRAMAALRNEVEHHVAEEESQIFAAAEHLGHEHLTRLGAEMEDRRRTLKTSPIQKALRGVKKLIHKAA